jgi:hypothetical protein
MRDKQACGQELQRCCFVALECYVVPVSKPEVQKMMRAIRVILTLLAIPAVAQAILECPDCVLGIWDDVGMTQSFGTLTPFTSKDLYLGIQLADGQTGLTGVEFSISGIDPAVLWVQNVQSVTTPGATILLGSIVAPQDTTQRGGMNAAWPVCIVGSQALLRITLAWIDPTPPVNLMLRVGHRYPPSNPTYGLSGPILIDCAMPPPEGYRPVRIRGGIYVFNPVVQTSTGTWGTVKGLYR